MANELQAGSFHCYPKKVFLVSLSEDIVTSLALKTGYVGGICPTAKTIDSATVVRNCHMDSVVGAEVLQYYLERGFERSKVPTLPLCITVSITDATNTCVS